MADSTSPRDHGISKDAFREYGQWTRRFSGRVRELAIKLAIARGVPASVTPEILAEAVRLTCEEIAAEIASRCQDRQSPRGPGSRVA